MTKMQQDVLFIMAAWPGRLRRSDIASRVWMRDEYPHLSLAKRTARVGKALFELREEGMVETWHSRWILTSAGRLEARGDGSEYVSPSEPRR